jgi:cbb3-type cytochrome oxidase subunit 3
LFSWEIFTNGNISVALMIKYLCFYGTFFSMFWTQLHSQFLVNFPLRPKFP